MLSPSLHSSATARRAFFCSLGDLFRFSSDNSIKAKYAKQQQLLEVFLEFNSEVRRATLTGDLRTHEGILQLFRRCFPESLAGDFLDNMAVYIQDSSKEGSFYELRDYRDIPERSLLCLQERHRQLPNNVPPPPSQTHSSRIYDPSLRSPGFVSETDVDAMLDFDDGVYSRSYRQQQHIGSQRMDMHGGRSSFRQVPSGPVKFGAPEPYRSASVAGRPYAQQHTSLDHVNSADSYGPRPAPRYRSVTALAPSTAFTTPVSGRQYLSPPRVRQRGSTDSSTHSSASAGSYQFNSNAAGNAQLDLRSGSITPVIVDEEARARMASMESQLASLSSLVHSALVSHRPGDIRSPFRDVELLRQQLFGDSNDQGSESGSVSRFSDVGSEKHSVGSSDRALSSDSSVLSPEMRKTLKHVRQSVHDIQSELRQVRRQTQLNAQTSAALLRETFERIRSAISSHANDGIGPSLSTAPLADSDTVWAKTQQQRFVQHMQRLEGEVTGLERDIETMRQRVINGEQRLRVAEVERFTEDLTSVAKATAAVKAEFPDITTRLKKFMATEMDKVVREEKFLKEEPEKIDAMLRRCKKLTNTMVTMKKLALIQDTEEKRLSDHEPEEINHENDNQQNFSKQPISGLQRSPHFENITVERTPLPTSQSFPRQPMVTRPSGATVSFIETPQVVDVSPAETGRRSQSSDVLDNILEELRTATGEKSNAVQQYNGYYKSTGRFPQKGHAPQPAQAPQPASQDNIRISDTIEHHHGVQSNGVGGPEPEAPQTDRGSGSFLTKLIDAQSKLRKPASCKWGRSQAPAAKQQNGKTPMVLHENVAVMHNGDRKGRKGVENAMVHGTPSRGSFDSGMSPEIANQIAAASESARVRGRPASMSPDYDTAPKKPPPPPPRTSSTNRIVGIPSLKPTVTVTKKHAADDLETEVMPQRMTGTGFANRQSQSDSGVGRYPLPSPVHTNALGDELNIAVRSASSSESINSQEAINRVAPPPPPPYFAQ